MGTVDRIIRILIAAVIIFLFQTEVITGTWGYVLTGIAVIFVLTSLVGVCPLYSVFKINTGSVKKT